jgi:hypothetical protein
MMFARDFCKKWDIASYHCRERFASKKNEVALYTFINSQGQAWDWVVKKYCQPQSSNKEAEILTVLYTAGLTVPKLIAAADNYLVLEYIKGQNLLTWCEEQEKKTQGQTITQEVVTVLEQLAAWFVNCYRILDDFYGYSIALNDVNLRNFIAAERIYGLDFEDCRAGTKVEDMGKFCAFALTYDPAFTFWKYQFILAVKDIIIKRLELPWNAVFLEMGKELQRMSQRRQRQDFSLDRLDAIK